MILDEIGDTFTHKDGQKEHEKKNRKHFDDNMN